jgi:uncharacterized membrane protein
MELFYVDGDRKVGPIGKNQFQSLIKTQKINAKTLVWQLGMPQWEEMGTFLGRNTHAHSATQSLVQSGYYAICSECRNVYDREDLIQIQDYWVCGGCKPIFIQKIKEGVRPRSGVTYKNYGSLEKGLKGEYDLAVFDVLGEAWRLTHGSKAVVIGSSFLVWIITSLIQNVVFFPLSFIFGIVMYFVDQVSGDTASAFFMVTVIILSVVVMMTLSLMAQAPLWVGLEMIGVRRSVDLPISPRYVFDYFRQFFPLALTCLVITVFVLLGFALLILPGIYLAIGSFLALQLVADKKMGPWNAFKASVRAITHKWFQVFFLILLLMGIMFLSAIPLGIGLIWTWPLFINTKGILYRNIFGIDQTV